MSVVDSLEKKMVKNVIICNIRVICENSSNKFLRQKTRVLIILYKSNTSDTQYTALNFRNCVVVIGRVH